MKKHVLISGASIAGLSTAWWMNELGYAVTVVEAAPAPRIGGTAVDLRGNTLAVIERMGLFDQVSANKLRLERIEFKNAADVTEKSMVVRDGTTPDPADADIEIERTRLVGLLSEHLHGEVEMVFGDSLAALTETSDAITATFKRGAPRSFDLVFGCDGLHSTTRRLWFGDEARFATFLGAYSSITIVDQSLIAPNTLQMFNVPGKMIMLNAYQGKTDVVFCFLADRELPYDYRDADQQRRIVAEQFAGVGWRAPELLAAVAATSNFYFDKFCQIKMPAWTKGRVALVGDAAYCASPAAGMGGALAMDGAAAVADALRAHGGDFEAAFHAYDRGLRAFIDEVQATAELHLKENFIPRTEAAILKRNAQPGF